MTDHMTDPAGAGIYANMTGVNLDGIHGTPFFSQHREWIRHGWNFWNTPRWDDRPTGD